MILYTLYPQKTEIGKGRLVIDKYHPQTAVFVIGEKVFSLGGVNLMRVSPGGMLLSGFEDAGMDRKKRARYYYQEWQIEFDNEEAKP